MTDNNHVTIASNYICDDWQKACDATCVTVEDTYVAIDNNHVALANTYVKADDGLRDDWQQPCARN